MVSSFHFYCHESKTKLIQSQERHPFKKTNHGAEQNVTAAKSGKMYARMFRFFLLNFDHERENLAQDFKADAELKQCKRSSF